MKSILLEVNKLNFTLIQTYFELDKLKNFTALFEKHAYIKTIPEGEQGDSEPADQWVTARIDERFDEHISDHYEGVHRNLNWSLQLAAEG